MTKKTIYFVLILFLSIHSSIAQGTFQYSLKGIKQIHLVTDRHVKLKNSEADSLLIGHYDGCEGCSSNTYIDRKSKGLRSIYQQGYDISGFALSIDKRGTTLYIKDLKQQQQNISLAFPKNVSIYIKTEKEGKVDGNGISSDMAITTLYGHVNLKNVSGPLTVNTIQGNVEVVFSSINQKSPTTIVSSYGHIDVTLSKSTKSNLDLQSRYGAIYTDFMIDLDKNKKADRGGRIVVGKINNGGVKILLNTNQGNIYLRQKK